MLNNLINRYLFSSFSVIIVALFLACVSRKLCVTFRDVLTLNDKIYFYN